MRSTATVCVILACVGGALSNHDGNAHAYLSQDEPPCGAFGPPLFHATNVVQIGSKNYTTDGGDVDGLPTGSKGKLWDDIKEELKRLEPSDSHKATYAGGLNGWTPEQHDYVNWLCKAIAGVDDANMEDKAQCQQLSKDLSTIYVNIEKLSDANRRTGDHTDEQHTDSSVSVNKRPWHSVAAALTIMGLANTMQKY